MSWQYLDKQMLPFVDRLTNEIKISEEIAGKLATNIAANVRFLSTEIKKEIKSATPIPINDRLLELKAFQGWMDFANTIENNPFITRAQVITQSYICFVYRGEQRKRKKSYAKLL